MTPAVQVAAKRVSLRSGPNGLAANVTWNVGAVLGGKAAAIAVIPVITRSVGLGGYGTWVQYIVTVNLCSMLLGMGLYQAIVQFYPEAEESRKQAQLVWSCAVLVAVAGAGLTLAVLSLDSILRGFSAGGVGTVLVLACAGASFQALRQLFSGVYRAQRRLRAFAIANFLSEWLTYAALAFAAMAFGSEMRMMQAFVLTSAMIVVVLSAIVRRRLGRLTFSIRTMKTCLGYGLPIIPTQLEDEVLARGDRLLIGGFLGPQAVGAYSAAYAVAGATQIFNTAMVNSLFPELVRRRTDASARGSLLGRALRAQLAVTLAYALVLGFAAVALWQLLAGAIPESISERELTIVTVSAALGIGCFGAGRISSLELFVAGRTLAVFAVWSVCTAANIGLNMLLVPRLQLLGAAIATLASYLVFMALMLAVSSGSRRSADRPDVASAVPGAQTWSAFS